jgi:O-methyltransferase involved in polyketide biosynthesis
MIAGSILDLAWIKGIRATDEPVLIIAEGLLFYFEEAEVRALLAGLAQAFPGAQMFLEILGPAFVGRARLNDSVGKMEGVEFRWSVKDSHRLEAFDPRIQFMEEWYFSDYQRRRWRWFGQVTRLTFLKQLLSNRIVHLRFMENPDPTARS